MEKAQGAYTLMLHILWHGIKLAVGWWLNLHVSEKSECIFYGPPFFKKGPVAFEQKAAVVFILKQLIALYILKCII